jgi:hypothetical protein
MMNSPEELALRLTRQWHNPHLREQRLLSTKAWPLEMAIGRPDAREFTNESDRVFQHIQNWRKVSVGEVEWIQQKYREAGEAVSIPRYWRINKPSEWVQATGNPQVESDYELLSRLVAQADPLFHPLLIRQLSRIRVLSESELIQVSQAALKLAPGCAQGKPLRAISIIGGDSKFIERNRRLLTGMLDLRFEDQVSEMGLEAFLGAVSEKDHWLLLAPLSPDLLPYKQLRIRATELMRRPLNAGRILIVENEQCLYQLPHVPDCIAVLGAGLNLSWMQAEWLIERQLAYWGDLDTWGLAMLGKARAHQRHVQPLMMEQRVFDLFEVSSVVEPVRYQMFEPLELTEQERQLFQYLLKRERGRLEQEFIPKTFVEETIGEWTVNAYTQD